MRANRTRQSGPRTAAVADRGATAVRVLAAAVGLGAVILVAISLIGVPVVGGSVAPPATSTPDAPGIAVATGSIDLPDPMFVTADGQYHMYLSSSFGDRSRTNVPEQTGRPGHWGPVTEALPSVPAWGESTVRGGRVWDPYVQKFGKGYLMYFSESLGHQSASVTALSTLSVHCLGVARSATAEGPFVPVAGPPIVCQPDHGGDIDVQPFIDPNGPNGAEHPWYLIWKSDDNNLRHPRPTLIWAAPLSNDGLRLTGAGRVIFQSDQAWERPVLEAPQMVS
jgi:hypothetical protein